MIMNVCKSDKNRWGEFCVYSLACYGLRGAEKDMLAPCYLSIGIVYIS